MSQSVFVLLFWVMKTLVLLNISLITILFSNHNLRLERGLKIYICFIYICLKIHIFFELSHFLTNFDLSKIIKICEKNTKNKNENFGPQPSANYQSFRLALGPGKFPQERMGS